MNMDLGVVRQLMQYDACTGNITGRTRILKRTLSLAMVMIYGV